MLLTDGSTTENEENAIVMFDADAKPSLPPESPPRELGPESRGGPLRPLSTFRGVYTHPDTHTRTHTRIAGDFQPPDDICLLRLLRRRTRLDCAEESHSMFCFFGGGVTRRAYPPSGTNAVNRLSLSAILSPSTCDDATRGGDV